MTTPDSPDFRAQCAELLAAIQLYTGLNPAASEMSSVEITEKLMDAMAATVAALTTPPPEPAPFAWLYKGDPDFDGKQWHQPYEVTLSENVAKYRSQPEKPIPLYKAQHLTPPPEPPTDEKLDELAWNWYSKTGSTWWQIESYRAFARAVLERWGNYPAILVSSIQVSPPEPPTDAEIAAAIQKGADQEFYATVKALAEYCDCGVELTDSGAREVLYELRRPHIALDCWGNEKQ